MNNTSAVLEFFQQRRQQLTEFVRAVPADSTAPDAAAVVDQAEDIFAGMVQDMAYVDAPRLVMAQALFFCAAYLAVYQVLRKHGTDVHTFGAAVLAQLRDQPGGGFEEGAEPGFESPGTHAGEFVVEVVKPGAGAEPFDWGYNIKSCAICYHFGKYDALDLVPYMCASDDVISDKQGQGLRRSGTIALGAHQCDFRYQAGGKPQRVAELHPQKIHFEH